ncbi:MAG: anaerobic sulfatase maturase [Desulfomonilia bacterium]
MYRQSMHAHHSHTTPKFAFQVMVKPVGPLCNLACTYCFYRYKTGLFPPTHDWNMSEDMLEDFVMQYLESQPDGYPVQFVWQGGEPCLRGIDFFKQAVESQRRYARPGQVIGNAFQTNATLITDEWARFFSAEDVLVGISIDGPEHIHDRYRRDAASLGSFDRVMAGLDCLRIRGVRTNALTCVTDASETHPHLVYEFLRKHFEFIQFIPVVEEKGFRKEAPFLKGSRKWETRKPKKPTELVMSWSVSATGYGKFLMAIFKEWVANDVGKISIQVFEETLAHWLGLTGELCIFTPTCGRALVMEHNGDVYSCDHFVYQSYRLGNIREKSLTDLAVHPVQARFGRDKLTRLPRQCRACEYLFLCAGECPKHRILRTPSGEHELNYLCEGYRSFFSFSEPAMRFMARELAEGRPPAGIMEHITNTKM